MTIELSNSNDYTIEYIQMLNDYTIVYIQMTIQLTIYIVK